MQKIIENLEKAIAIIGAIPEAKIYLGQIKTECGTIACAAGWLASDPYFNAQGMGLVMGPYGGSYWLVQTAKPDFLDYKLDWLEPLFGDDAFNKLFATRNDSALDTLLNLDNALSDKELALARLNDQLGHYQTMLDSE